MSAKSSNPLNSKGKEKTTNSEKKASNTRKFKSPKDPEVLLELPGGFKYRAPGKSQRVVVGSIVLGLNVLLVISVILYFYSPAFQDFIYNVGRN